MRDGYAKSFRSCGPLKRHRKSKSNPIGVARLEKVLLSPRYRSAPAPDPSPRVANVHTASIASVAVVCTPLQRSRLPAVSRRLRKLERKHEAFKKLSGIGICVMTLN